MVRIVMYISLLTRDEAPEESQPMLDGIAKQVGWLPNVFRVAAHSPSALRSLVSQHEQVGQMLDPKLRDQIALAVAQANNSPYCLAAHTYWAKRHGMSAEEIELSRQGEAKEAKANAAICFAVSVAKSRGQATERELDAVRAAGYTNAEVVDLLATTAYHLFTNYISNVLKTEIDREFASDETFRHGP